MCTHNTTSLTPVATDVDNQQHSKSSPGLINAGCANLGSFCSQLAARCCHDQLGMGKAWEGGKDHCTTLARGEHPEHEEAQHGNEHDAMTVFTLQTCKHPLHMSACI